jgi:hypothetical protein
MVRLFVRLALVGLLVVVVGAVSALAMANSIPVTRVSFTTQPITEAAIYPNGTPTSIPTPTPTRTP